MTSATARRPDRRRFPLRNRAIAVFGIATLSAGVLASCSSSGGNATAPGRPGPPPIPLTSSSSSSGATWASLAMGHLGDPVNTFWQLVTLPAGALGWSLATPPGVASNGGLVVALGTDGSVLSGFGPTQDLLFSPLAQSSDQGTTWTTGVLPGGLVLAPDTLASSGDGSIALLRKGGGTVVQGSPDLTGWSDVVTEQALAHQSSGSGCGVIGLTAVGTYGAPGSGGVGTLLVGAACQRPAPPGIFERSGRDWMSVAPTLPGAPPGPTEVIRLVGLPTGAAALVGVGSGTHVTVFALWSTDGLQTWTISQGLPLDGVGLTSTGGTASGGFVVGAAGRNGQTLAATVGPSSPVWQRLLPPPVGTSAVVATPQGGFDALIVDQSTLDVSSLGGTGWKHTQALAVPIQYGSSS